MSGVGKYDLFVNEEWTIADYDSKNNRLTCYFDESSPKGLLRIKIVVTDRVGNEGVLNYLYTH